MYFTNKKFTIDKEKMAIINSRFSQYDEAKLGRISPKDARLILRELGIDNIDAQKIVAKADPEKRSLVKYESLLETLRLHLVCSHSLYSETDVFIIYAPLLLPICNYCRVKRKLK
jgi:Ca2+-binding EF-hand superfamily protein